MRIQSNNFLLTFIVEHTSNNNNVMTIDVYGIDFEPLPVQRTIKNNIETIDVSTYLPNRVMLVLSGKTNQDNQAIKLLSMSLAGIKINNSIIMSNLVDYRPILTDKTPTSLRDYLDNESWDPTLWDQNGCVLFEIFNPNPFSYLLYKGNQIHF
jgi:hypothetical protein